MLKGKTALVTGSTSGIGLGIAEALARDGANLVLNGFGDAAGIERLHARLTDTYRVTVRHDGADLSQPDAIERMVKSAIAEFGAVDVLVNNAGVLHSAPVEDLPPVKWDAVLAIDLSAAFHATRFALPAMKARGWGRLINVASALALVGMPGLSAYAAAKHGLAGFTKTVALEVAEQGITVNAICPGYVRTPLIERQIAETAQARGISEEQAVRDVLLAAQPTRRFVHSEELAALVLFLASDAAASITGAVIPIDGGWTAH
jgi:3-hydroxybutyrate dehydrogenase